MGSTELATIIVAAIAAVPATIAAVNSREAKRSAREANVNAAAANRAVNNVGPGEDTLVEKVDRFMGRVEHLIAGQEFITADVTALKGTMGEGVVRLKNVETALAHVTHKTDEALAGLAHVSEQASEAARLVAEVKADKDASHERANTVPPTAPPGTAADAGFQTTEPGGSTP